MSQMVERLEAVEGSISDITEATSLEDIQTVKVRAHEFLIFCLYGGFTLLSWDVRHRSSKPCVI